jgi:hypothetical protein
MNLNKQLTRYASFALLGALIVISLSAFVLSDKVQKTSLTQQKTQAAEIVQVPESPALAPIPSGLPNTFQFGLFNEDITSMHPNVPYYWRYGYIAGWRPSDVTNFIQQSLSHSPSYHSGFAYYWIYGSLTNCPYGDGNEVQKLNNASCMNQYYTDFKNFLIATHNATTEPVIYVFEPDLEGVMQQETNGADNAANQPTKVRSSNMADVSAYPDTYAGFHQAIAHLRDVYAPNVKLAIDISLWGTGDDLTICLRNGGCDWQTIANRTATYYNSFGSGFDMLSFSPLDRDSACYFTGACNGGSSSNRWWWDDNSREPKFSTFSTWLGSVSQQTNKRVIMWQVPNGNRVYKSENNTSGHYQDNRPEYFLNPTNGRANIQEWMNAGVIGLMWGAGAGSQSHYRDSNGDGITNPHALDGTSGYAFGNPMNIANTQTASYADDDGGYIRLNVTNYYNQGALPLPGGTPTSPTPTPSGPTNTPTPTVFVTPTNTPQPTPTGTQTANVYTDALASGWQNWSYGSTINMSATQYVQSGTRSTSITYTRGYGGLYWAHDGFNTTGYDRLVFYVNGGANSGQSVNINLVDINGNYLTELPLNSYIQGGSIAANTWRQVVVPLSDLQGSNTTITGVVLAEALGVVQPAYYVDQMYFTNNVTTSPTPTVYPSQSPIPFTITPTQPPPTPTRTPTPTTQPTNTPIPSGNWTGSYYNNMNVSGTPVFSRQDANINFNWGTGSPDSRIRKNKFSVKWTKTVTLAAGTYRFNLRSDDGMRLYINGSLMRNCNFWYDQSPTTHTCQVTLSAGTYNLRVDFYDDQGGAVAVFSY